MGLRLEPQVAEQLSIQQAWLEHESPTDRLPMRISAETGLIYRSFHQVLQPRMQHSGFQCRGS
jgi:hypothetical protein